MVCYFSAGTLERGRPDPFPPRSAGEPLEGWPDERWLDIRRARRARADPRAPARPLRPQGLRRRRGRQRRRLRQPTAASRCAPPTSCASTASSRARRTRAGSRSGSRTTSTRSRALEPALRLGAQRAVLPVPTSATGCARSRPPGRRSSSPSTSSRRRRSAPAARAAGFMAMRKRARAGRGAGAMLVSVCRSPSASGVRARQPSRAAAAPGSRQERRTSPARVRREARAQAERAGELEHARLAPVATLQQPAARLSPAAHERLDDVGDVDEVARLAAVAEDRHRRGPSAAAAQKIAITPASPPRPGAGRRRSTAAGSASRGRAAAR